MIGRVVNNYQIKSVVAEGGMGTVYLAEHPFMGRKAAIKVLRRHYLEDKDMVTRFVNEARAANAIHHPNIVEIIDVGYLPDGVPYLMMEFLAGETLASRLVRAGRLSAGDAAGILEQAAAALEATHAAGIIHRDLKPDNLFLVPDSDVPGGERVKVVDFGIAKLTEAAFGPSARTGNSAIGTPHYMAPEQCRGGPLDHRADIYALGAILYEMLCGQPPFQAESTIDVMMMHVGKIPVAPRQLVPGIPEALEQVTMRALAKRPEDRFASMAELRAALRPFVVTPSPPPRTGPAIEPSAEIKPVVVTLTWHRRAPWVALAMVVGVGTGAAVASRLAHRGHPAPPPVAAAIPAIADAGRAPPSPVAAVAAPPKEPAPPAVRCGNLGTSPCSACIAGNCCREYQACESDRICKRALARYNGCMHRPGDDRASVCWEQFGTRRNRKARALASCAFVRLGGPRVQPGRCAAECDHGSISDDACAAYCSCMSETCRITMDPAACPNICAHLSRDQVTCRTYHCALASRSNPELHCQHAIGHLQMCE